MKAIGLLFALALTLDCQGCHHPQPALVTPSSVGDAAPATCLDLCRHEADLNCPAAQATPAGATCLAVCQNVQDANIAPWNLSCRTAAPTCAAIDACP